MAQVFETTDLELAERIVQDSYGDALRIEADGGPTKLRLATMPLNPSLRLEEITVGFTFGLRADPSASWSCAIRSGRITYGTSGGERTYGPGEVFVPVVPEQASTARCEDSDFQTAILDPALPGQIANTAPARRPEPVRFVGFDPISPAATAIWNRTYRYVQDVLGAPASQTSPLVTGNLARLLTATALTVFPNTALRDPTIEDRHDAHADTLRRATAFIDDNAHRDVGVADIASAAFVTVRAVQLAFRRHLDTTPMAYLRRARLHGAHRDLQAADPATETVSGIAARWGFTDHSRFAAQYHTAYGRLPSATLRTR